MLQNGLLLMKSNQLRSLVRRARNQLSVRALGYFPYFGEKVFCSRNNHILDRISIESIFEEEILKYILMFIKPKSCFFDVGANIGALTIPVLRTRPDIEAVSVECSPSTLPYLEQTYRQSNFSARWKLDRRAVAMLEGLVQFHTTGSDFGAFDSLQDTGRGGVKKSVLVQAATLDRIWIDHGAPDVSVLKIDIEGGEFEAILSGRNMIEKCRPVIIFEWSEKNLQAFDRNPQSIFQILDEFPGEFISLPTFHTLSKSNLRLVMSECEMFILMLE